LFSEASLAYSCKYLKDFNIHLGKPPARVNLITLLQPFLLTYIEPSIILKGQLHYCSWVCGKYFYSYWRLL